MSLLIITIDTPSPRQAAQQPVDLRLGADVDAARRLVDDQHLRAEREPLGQHHLLLVAAAQGRRRDVDGRRLDLQLLGRPPPTACRSGASDDEPVRRVAVQRRQRDVLADREVHDQAGDRRSSGTRKTPCRMASAGLVDPQPLPVEADGPADRRLDPEHRPRDLGAARRRPGRPSRESRRGRRRTTRRAADTAAVRSPRRVKYAAASACAGPTLVLDVEVAADHQPDHVVVRQLVARRARRRSRRRAARRRDRRSSALRRAGA